MVELDEPYRAVGFETLAGKNFSNATEIMRAMPAIPATPKAKAPAMAQPNFRLSVGVGMRYT